MIRFSPCNFRVVSSIARVRLTDVGRNSVRFLLFFFLFLFENANFRRPQQRISSHLADGKCAEKYFLNCSKKVHINKKWFQQRWGDSLTHMAMERDQ